MRLIKEISKCISENVPCKMKNCKFLAWVSIPARTIGNNIAHYLLDIVQKTTKPMNTYEIPSDEMKFQTRGTDYLDTISNLLEHIEIKCVFMLQHKLPKSKFRSCDQDCYQYS